MISSRNMLAGGARVARAAAARVSAAVPTLSGSAAAPMAFAPAARASTLATFGAATALPLGARTLAMPAVGLAASPLVGAHGSALCVPARPIFARLRNTFTILTAKVPTITAAEYLALPPSPTSVLVDVRSVEERVHNGFVPWSVPTPLNELLQDPALQARYTGLTVFVMCHSGVRSDTATRCMRHVGIHAVNIKDGYVGFYDLPDEVEAAAPAHAAIALPRSLTEEPVAEASLAGAPAKTEESK